MMADPAVATPPAGAQAPASAPAAGGTTAPQAQPSDTKPSLLAPEAPKAAPPEAPKESTKDAKPAEIKADIKLTVAKDSMLKQAQADKIAAFARERGLSQDVAEASMKFYEGELKALVDGEVKAYNERIATRNAEWDKALKNHPEYGGEKLKEWGEGAYEVLMKYGGEDAIKLFNEEAFAKHPVVAKLLWNLHKAHRPDKIVAPKAPSAPADKKSVAESLFPSAVKK